MALDSDIAIYIHDIKYDIYNLINGINFKLFL